MLNRINDKVYYLSNEDEKERPALGLVCGERYSLIIDAGNSPQHAKDFIQEIGKLDVPPVKYVVITHAHWDHFLGMNEFDATVIVNRQTNEILNEWQTFTYDDSSLETLVSTSRIDAKCMEILKEEMPERDRFKLKSPDIVFEGNVTVDLGNKICIIEKIASTHTDDSTIVYVPDEKVLFLGDSGYGKTTNGLFHIQQSLLTPMIADIQKYDAEMTLLGHESVCDAAEMDLYWKELSAASMAVTSTSRTAAEEIFRLENKREPNDNELFFIKAFANDWIIQAQ